MTLTVAPVGGVVSSVMVSAVNESVLFAASRTQPRTVLRRSTELKVNCVLALSGCHWNEFDAVHVTDALSV
ncbi:MAG TPA: hypothetical protein VGF99_07510, partial [Myxococcota bacterium]